MDLINAYQEIVTKPKVAQLINDNNHILTHACLIQEANSSNGWEFGFFNKETQKVIVFESSPYKERQEDEILKKEDAKINPIHFEDLVVNFDSAVKILDAHLLEKGVMLVTKKIVILQNDGVLSWNMTVMTQDFNLVNVKIDAKSGEILKSDKISIYDMGLKKA